jgi:hypothetical protein
MRQDEQAMEQARAQRDHEDRQKAAAKAKPYQEQHFPKAS